ncbi:hypothetical protein ACQP2K_18900 [Microbispora siamensis]
MRNLAHLLSWRAAFCLLALFGILLVITIARKLPEPTRGGQGRLRPDAERDGRASPGRSDAVHFALRDRGVEPDPALMLRRDPTRMSMWEAALYVLRIRTNVVLITASAVTSSSPACEASACSSSTGNTVSLRQRSPADHDLRERRFARRAVVAFRARRPVIGRAALALSPRGRLGRPHAARPGGRGGVRDPEEGRRAPSIRPRSRPLATRTFGALSMILAMASPAASPRPP